MKSLRARARVPLALCLFAMILGGAVLRGSAVFAEQKADASAVVADLDDLDRLRALQPLKLQADQMDRLITALTSAKADYDAKVNSLGTSIFASSASEVRDVKKQTLAGTAIPKAFDDKIKQMQADFLKQRDALNTANIKAVAAAARGVLTDKQVAVATKLERDQWDIDHPTIKDATDAQLFNLYCVDIFISNPRSIPLLKEMRAATK